MQLLCWSKSGMLHHLWIHCISLRTVLLRCKSGLEYPDFPYLLRGGVVYGAEIIVHPQVHKGKKSSRSSRKCPCKHISRSTRCSRVIRRCLPFPRIFYAVTQIALLTRFPLYVENRPPCISPFQMSSRPSVSKMILTGLCITRLSSGGSLI